MILVILFSKEYVLASSFYFLLLGIFENYGILGIIIIRGSYNLEKNVLKKYIIFYLLLLLLSSIILSDNVFFNAAIFIIMMMFKVQFLPTVDKGDKFDKSIENNKYLYKSREYSNDNEFKKLYRDTKQNIYMINYKNIETYQNFIYFFILLVLLSFGTLIYIEFYYNSIPKVLNAFLAINGVLSMIMLLRFDIIRKSIIQLYYEINYGNKEYVDNLINNS